MSKHDLKARQLQVEEIISPSATPVQVRDLLRYQGVQDYTSPRDIPDIEKVQSIIGESSGGSGTIETNVDITDQVALSINWQTDIDPESLGGQTYAERHGNRRIRVFGLWDNGGNFTNYSPNLSFTKNVEGLITAVNITEIFPGIVTII